MKQLALLATIAGLLLMGGCTIGFEGVSFSESSFVDNNCTGNGGLADPEFCENELRASAGPWAFHAGES